MKKSLLNKFLNDRKRISSKLSLWMKFEYMSMIKRDALISRIELIGNFLVLVLWDTHGSDYN